MQVTDEYEMDQYKKKLKSWETERQRQQVEFTITEHDLEADKRIPSAPAEITVSIYCVVHFVLLLFVSLPIGFGC